MKKLIIIIFVTISMVFSHSIKDLVEYAHTNNISKYIKSIDQSTTKGIHLKATCYYGGINIWNNIYSMMLIIELSDDIKSERTEIVLRKEMVILQSDILHYITLLEIDKHFGVNKTIKRDVIKMLKKTEHIIRNIKWVHPIQKE